MLKRTFFPAFFLPCISLAQTPPVFNHGALLSLFAQQDRTLVQPQADLTSAAPLNLTLSLANASWLSFAPLPKNKSGCDDPSLQYTSGSSFITRSILASDWMKDATGPNYTLSVCFRVSQAKQGTPGYLPDGWYSGYLRVVLANAAAPVLYPIRLTAVPSGYLTLSNGADPIDGCDADNPTPACQRLKIDAGSGAPLQITAKINTTNGSNDLPPSTRGILAIFDAADDNTASFPSWLAINGANSAPAASPVDVSNGYTFNLAYKPGAALPPGAATLSGHFWVQSTGGYQDRSSVHFTIVNLPPVPNASFQLSSTLLTFASGGSLSQPLTIGSAGQPISFNISFNKDWLTAAPASGSTPATVIVTVDPARIQGASDTGTLTIADASGKAQAATIIVSATAPAPCTFGLSRPSDSVGAGAGSGSVGVTTGPGCAWSATSDASWLKLTGGQSGAGPGTIAYAYDANSGPVRSGHISVNGQQFTLTQAAPAPSSIQFTVDSSQIAWGATAKLSWRVSGAASVSIDQGIGAVGSSGNRTVRPGRTTKYTLTAQGAGGPQTAAVTVAVAGQPPGNRGLLTASPNPILSAAPSGGPTTLSWSAPQSVQSVEIHINAPNGELLGAGGNSGSVQTGSSVTDGTTFYLQDVTSGNPLTATNTLDSVTVWVAPPDATFFKASPVYLASGKDSGTALLSWNATGAANVQIWVGSSGGTQMTGDLPSTGSTLTGDWAKEGMTFYLQNSVNGAASGDSNTIAVLQAGFAAPPAAPGPGANMVLFYADPNPITADASKQAGKGKLYWHAPGYSQLAILVLAPDGPQMTGTLPGDGSVDIPDWITDGMAFYLQDAASGSPAGAGNTLAALVVAVNH